jgi:hypothetical protein
MANFQTDRTPFIDPFNNDQPNNFKGLNDANGQLLLNFQKVKLIVNTKRILSNMEEKNSKMCLYDEIVRAIRLHAKNIQVNCNVQEAEIRHTIRMVMRDNPDIFWFAYQWDMVDGIISFGYVFPKAKASEIKLCIADIIQNDFQINYVRTLSQAEKVMYVYKWVIRNCSFNKESAYNQSIYSVFILRNSVCSGYAKTIQYLLKLLDIDCRLVYGKLNGSEENSKHCWNLVNIEGIFYHIDASFGDQSSNRLLSKSGIKDIWEINGINYNFFCVSTETIMKSRTIEDLGKTPSSNADFSRYQIEQLSNCNIKSRESNKGILLSSKGTTADIYLCTKDKKTILKCYRDKTDNRIVDEYLFMKRLTNCPHVLHINDQFSNVEEGVLAIEQAVPVSEILQSPDNTFTLKDSLTMIKDIATAVDECCWNSVFYHDIHLNNIYKTSEGLYKLADFGSCSKLIQTDALLVKGKIEGSPWFLSPETYLQGTYSIASATYSLSLLLYFILNDLTPPFWNEYKDERAYNKRYDGYEIPPLCLYYIDDDIQYSISNFLKKGLAYNEKDRYRSIQQYIDTIGELLSLLEERDYSLQITKPDMLFSTTTIPDMLFSTTTIPDMLFSTTTRSNRFIESQNETGSESEDNSNFNAIPAKVRCPNCNNIYKINIDSNFYKQSLRPLLCNDTASGGISVIRKNTDYAVCPNCHYEITIVDCFETHIISLPTQRKTNRIDNFSHTGFPFSITQEPISITQDKTKLTDRKYTYHPYFSEAHPDKKYAPQSGKRVFSSYGTILQKNNAKRKNLIKIFFEKRLFNKKQETFPEKVFSSIFAPAEVKPISHMQVQVYLHLFEESEIISRLAVESDKRAERRDYIPLQCILKKNDKVDVQLNISGETLLMSEKKSVIWQGTFTKCSFDYFVPKDIGVDELSCVALLTVNEIPVGEMRFITRIVDVPQQLNTKIIAHKYNKVFISYSHQDESKVKFLHEGLELGGIPHFFDRKYLKPGDVFPQVIQDYINTADLFILCWSENASKSEYVKKERLLALELAFPQVKPQQAAKLSIYPMSIEPRAELPSDMIDYYHFGEI